MRLAVNTALDPFVAAANSAGLDPAGVQKTPAWDRAVYDSLVAVLGETPLVGMAHRFRGDLAARFSDVDDREALRRDAHAIASSAGMLGFRALSGDCKALEQACAGGADLGQPLAKLVAARADADRCLADLLSGAR